MTNRLIFGTIATIALIGAIFAFSPIEPASAAGKKLIQSDIVGLPDPMIAATGVMVRGVGGGGCPWVVADSDATIDKNGKLKIKIKGLLIVSSTINLDCNLPTGPEGSIGPVFQVFASLTCEGTGVVATTTAAPLNANGDAKIKETITLPPTCVGPIILVRANGAGGPWIAASGF